MTKRYGRPAAHGRPVALLVLLAALCVAVATVPGVAGHGAPAPHEAAVRLLHDHNDDCGGDGVAVNCRGTHDLIALDVREAWDEELGNVLVFRFIMDEGDSGTLTEMLTFTAAGATKEYTLDPGASSGTDAGGFDRVGEKRPIGDGTRFSIDATLAWSSLQVTTGDTLRDLRVEALRDGTPGDFMPGGYHGPAGTVQDPPEGNDRTSYARPLLRLEGPVQYGEMTIDPPSATLEPDVEFAATVSVQNGLRKEAQSFTLTLMSDTGVEARFHDPEAGGDGYSSTYTIDVEPGGRGGAHLAVVGTQPGAHGGVLVTVTSDKGARMQEVFAFGVGTAPPATSATTTSPAGSEDPAQDTAAAPLAAVVLLLAFVLARRR